MTTMPLCPPEEATDFTTRLVGYAPGATTLDILRTLTGAALACVFGAACTLGGLRFGQGAQLFELALPIVLFAGAYSPSLYILLAVTGHDPDPAAYRHATAQGSAATGLVLAGLAPAAALFELAQGDGASRDLAIALEVVGCGVAGLIGYRTFAAGVRDSLPEGDRGVASSLLLAGFLLLATALSARIWIGALVQASVENAGAATLGGIA